MEKQIIEQFGKGALPDIFSPKDYLYEHRTEIFGAPQVNWDNGFEVEEAKDIKIEDQNGSSSCTGQAVSKYCEVLERIENKNFIDLSAKFIYSQVALPNAQGAYIRDAISIPVKYGVALESDLPSYPATEENMTRKEDITGEIKQRALTYQAKEYYSTWHKDNIDTVASLIMEGNGAIMGIRGTNEGWKNAWVSPVGIDEAGPKAWGHAIFAHKFFKKDGKKYIGFINSWGKESWGDNGIGYLEEDYFRSRHVFSIWSLLDKTNIIINPNNNNMFKLYKKSNSEKIYVVSGDTYFWILDPDTLGKGVNSLWEGWDKVAINDDIDIQFKWGGALFIASTDIPNN